MHIKHPDAIGYSNDLAKKVCEEWFTMICDLAAIIGKSALDQHDLDTLFAIFTKNASYLGIKSTMTPTASTRAVALTDFLETLSGFSNFKLLPGTLQISFTKRITLVFGANGSGKSSLCESLKLLASTEAPSRPLHNVRAAGTTVTDFNYKFSSDSTVQKWSLAAGYGPRHSTIKYFDTGIAIKNVKNSVEPGRVIELTPFKLHVFEWIKLLTTQLRTALQKAQQDNAAKLRKALEEVRECFAESEGRLLATINEKSLSSLKAEIKLGEAFTQYELLQERLVAAAELEKAASAEGLKLQKAGNRELDAFLTSIGILIDSADGLWTLQPVAKANSLSAKQEAQELLAKALIPEDGTLETLLSLLRIATTLCNFESAEHEACPLCRRELSEPEVTLFKRYHELLSGQLETELTTLRADLEKAENFCKAIIELDREEWDKSSTLPPDLLTDAKVNSELIICSCGLGEEPTDQAQKALASLKELSAKGRQLLEQKAKVIEIAENGTDQLKIELAKVRREIEPLEYAKLIATRLEALREVQRMADNAAFWDSKLTTFPQLLKRITDASKEAHEELVVSDFETRLNNEYLVLTEKPMNAFGVSLSRKGNDASVTLLSHIGGKEIAGVLSEGEQRIHALALFFAELETCPQSIIVFDDPISSFDYNYIANYCIRLRDFTLRHPDKQIIVLTHNWEFFVQLQTTINQARLNGHLAVQVLENCSMIGEYSENIEDLKTEITAILTIIAEPTKAQKEKLAGIMRRLVEAVVNTHVFNNQRHQYKQKSQAVSDFQHFTKLVPLEPTEATTLRELYARLSISEHDDPRNAYITTDKATFQSRYDKILAVEAAIISRK
jgi:energy-coupling factor transporter ATP-binding protein EcfA2